jgi:hypothetical protein
VVLASVYCLPLAYDKALQLPVLISKDVCIFAQLLAPILFVYTFIHPVMIGCPRVITPDPVVSVFADNTKQEEEINQITEALMGLRESLMFIARSRHNFAGTHKASSGLYQRYQIRHQARP